MFVFCISQIQQRITKNKSPIFFFLRITGMFLSSQGFAFRVPFFCLKFSIPKDEAIAFLLRLSESNLGKFVPPRQCDCLSSQGLNIRPEAKSDP